MEGMASSNATSIESPLDALYYFLYPGPHCEQLCVFAISTALVIVVLGAIIFVGVFIYICISMPSKKAENEMKAVRIELRKEWDERKKLKAEQSTGVKVRTERKEETSGNGTDRSSSFFHVNFNNREVRFEDEHAATIEMQPITTANPLQRTVVVAPPNLVVEPTPVDSQTPQEAEVVDEESVLLRRSASYDDVYETPRSSIIFGRPFVADGYLSDEEYLDARSTIYDTREDVRFDRERGEESDSDRTLTMTSTMN